MGSYICSGCSVTNYNEYMHDGDTVSNNFVLSKEANDEIRDYLDNKKAIVTPSTQLAVGLNTDLAEVVIYNLSRRPSEQELTKHK